MSDAFDLILGIYRSPARAPLLRTRKLPDDAIDIIRIAAGDAEAIASARETTRLNEADLHEAAGLLLHHLLFFDGADSYRTLGVHRDAEPKQIKHHYRWLVRWLHPDRDPDNMHSVFADRINRAWNSIRNAERRASYDETLATDGLGPENSLETTDSAALLRNWANPSPAPLLSGRTVRRLPQIVAVGGAVIAFTLLSLAIWLHAVELRRSGTLMPNPAAAATSNAADTESAPFFPPAAPAAPPQASHDLDVPANGAGAVASDSTSSLPASSPAYSVARIPERDNPVWQHPPLPAALPVAKAAPAHETRAVDSRLVSSVGRETVVHSASIDAVPHQDGNTILSESEVAQFVDRFQRLYAANNVDEFLALFSAEARGNDAGDFADIAADYRRLFAQRHFRQLSLSGMKWEFNDNTALGKGRYDAVVGATADKPESRTHGSITLGLRRNSDGVLITQLRHVLSE